MPELTTKTLNELTVIEELGENDKILVESNGLMKRCTGSLGSGGGIVLNIEPDPESEYARMINITPVDFGALLANGQIPIFHIVDNQEEWETYNEYYYGLSYYHVNNPDSAYPSYAIVVSQHGSYYAYSEDDIFRENTD